MTRFLRLALLLPAIALVAGCSAQNPEDLPPEALPDAGPDLEGGIKLRVDDPVSSTPWESVPITGVGPGGGTLLIDTPRGEDVHRLGATGQFCIDVTLNDGENEIAFSAISATGEKSATSYVKVIKQGEPPVVEPIDPAPVQLADRTDGSIYYESQGAYDGSYFEYTTLSLESGEFQDLVDGATNELVKFSGQGVAAGEIVAFKLPSLMSIHGFKVTVGDQGDETCGPEAYEMWVSDDVEPELTLDGVVWHKIAQRSGDKISASATTYTDNSSVPGIRATHFAIKMTNSSCEHWFLGYGEYGLAELRIIAEEDGEGAGPQTSGAPSCASGGF